MKKPETAKLALFIIGLVVILIIIVLSLIHI